MRYSKRQNLRERIAGMRSKPRGCAVILGAWVPMCNGQMKIAFVLSYKVNVVDLKKVRVGPRAVKVPY